MYTLNLKYEMPFPEAEALLGLLLDADAYDILVDESADVYTPRGALLCKYRKGLIPPEMAEAAYQSLRGAARVTDNRGYATGRFPGENVVQKQPILKDGRLSATLRTSAEIKSGIIGFYDRYIRFPMCRVTAWTMDNREKFMAGLPLLQFASERFREEVPERYKAQQSVVEHTNPAFFIPGTVFTTITVNSNWQTAVHRDAGDLKVGYGVMAVLGQNFEGGHFVFPAYRIGIKLRPGDLIFDEVHELHCNTPIVKMKPDGERLSLVMYYREMMERCGTPAQELESARARQEGEPLWEPNAPLFDR